MPLRFFADADELKDWFRDHHDKLDEQWIGFYKKHTGIPSIDWAQSVDVALCFGWIDGLRKSLGATSYKIRFTPRREGSRWSKRNLSRMEALMAEGLVEEAGLAVFQAPGQVLAGRPDGRQGPARVAGETDPGPSQGIKLLPSHPAVVPKGRIGLDQQRQEGGDPSPKAGPVDRVLRGAASRSPRCTGVGRAGQQAGLTWVRAEPNQKAIYDALGIDPAPGGVRKMTV